MYICVSRLSSNTVHDSQLPFHCICQVAVVIITFHSKVVLIVRQLIVQWINIRWLWTCWQIRYDDELQGYLKSQGLRSLKVKPKKKAEPKHVAVPAQRNAPAAVAAAQAQPPPAHSTPAVTQQQQLAQAFMGLPIAGMGGGLPMAVGMPPGMMGMLPHFSQVSILPLIDCIYRFILTICGLKYKGAADSYSFNCSCQHGWRVAIIIHDVQIMCYVVCVVLLSSEMLINRARFCCN